MTSSGSKKVAGSAAPTSPRKRRGKHKIGHPEAILQQAMVDFYRTCVIHGDSFLFAVANGEKRDPVTAGKLVGISALRRKRLPDDDQTLPFGQGVVPGTHDLVLLLDGRRCPLPLAMIEVKVPELRDAEGRLVTEGGTLSKAQRAVHKVVKGLGHASFVVTSLDAWECLLRHLGLRLRTVQAQRPRTVPADDDWDDAA